MGPRAGRPSSRAFGVPHHPGAGVRRAWAHGWEGRPPVPSALCPRRSSPASARSLTTLARELGAHGPTGGKTVLPCLRHCAPEVPAWPPRGHSPPWAGVRRAWARGREGRPPVPSANDRKYRPSASCILYLRLTPIRSWWEGQQGVSSWHGRTAPARTSPPAPNSRARDPGLPARRPAGRWGGPAPPCGRRLPGRECRAAVGCLERAHPGRSVFRLAHPGACERSAICGGTRGGARPSPQHQPRPCLRGVRPGAGGTEACASLSIGSVMGGAEARLALRDRVIGC